jgi:hypothetical protein
MNVENLELEQQIQTLRSRATRVERLLVGASVVVVVLLVAGWQSVDSPQDIKARSLSIVDAKGVVRVSLGAPVPDPVIEGKVGKRRSPATGIIFSDAAGNEHGGMAMLDDGSMNLCFDDAKTERNCLFMMPKMGNGVALMDAKGETRAMLYLDTAGIPHLTMKDDKGKTVVSLPEETKPSTTP